MLSNKILSLILISQDYSKGSRVTFTRILKKKKKINARTLINAQILLTPELLASLEKKSAYL